MCDPHKRLESILAMMRLAIGNMDTDDPNNEEKDLIEKVIKLGDHLSSVLNEKNPTLLIATITLIQLLEDTLCSYEEEMPFMVTAAVCKLSHHGAQHIQLKDNPGITNSKNETIH